MIRFATCMLAAAALLAGCAAPQPVAAWEKGNLAKPIMAFDPDPLYARARQQVYLREEAASSGAAVGGSGCGEGGSSGCSWVFSSPCIPVWEWSS